MSFRAPLLRTRLPQTVHSIRPLTTFASRPLPSSLKTLTPKSTNTLFGSRFINTSPVARLEVSQPLGDGGVEEAPHSGINVNRAVRMDT
ncbi:hypothetical protein IAR55_000297 [Kwoniella newhampshirensis]|uniref:Uncharacterized protein n=1 Tax=Kwoniella newhampshirensis TaxID=1651941 RepID=A0AAW0Z6Y3_9TREE